MRHALAPALLALCAQLAAADPAVEALDKAVAELPKAAAHDHDHAHGARKAHDHAPSLRLVDLSLSVMGAAGVSTASDHDLEDLKLGGHDPNRRGFTLQGAELSITGAVDPYFTAEAHILATPDHGIELVEAFITTTALPHGLEAKAGHQLLEFGRANVIHGHAAAWLDQAVITGRLFGGEGSRGTGLRVAWMAPTPWYSQVSVGAFNADDASLVSFRGEAGGHGHDEEEGPERTIGGRLRGEELDTRSTRELVWLARWENSADLGGAEAKLGLSWLGGPNAAAADTRSDLYGADLVVGMRPAHGPFSSVKFTAEGMLRRAEVPAGEDPGEDGDISTGADNFLVPDATLTDWGFYAQLELGLGEHWLVGVRGEYADASGDSAEHEGLIDNRDDMLRDRRTRVSPLLAWKPSEFSRLRLQYDYDRSTAYEDDEAHSVWLGLDVLIGAHPPHGF